MSLEDESQGGHVQAFVAVDVRKQQRKADDGGGRLEGCPARWTQINLRRRTWHS